MLGLPLNFAHDFLPERRLLSQLLPFAAAGGSGDKVEIGARTGIPTGASSGKVEPMIHYACGMGLVHAEKSGARWRLTLTDLGRVVVSQDPFLSEAVTLWLLHLMLCRRQGLEAPAAGIADAWFLLFAEGRLRLGERFTRSQYHDFLGERHGTKGYLRSLSGLVPRAYLEPGCLGPIGALALDNTEPAAPRYQRRSAPLELACFPAYSAYLWAVWDLLYPDQEQLAIDELFSQSRALAILGWDQAMVGRLLDWLTDRGMIQLDRQTGSALALRLRETRQVMLGIYDELI